MVAPYRDDMSHLIGSLLSVPAPLAYALIAALVFGEAAVFVGFVLPGETAVLLEGVLASAGKLSLPAVLAIVVLAAVLGDSVGYEVGRHFGPRVLTWRPLRRHQTKLNAARESLRERGGWAVFLGRFTAFLRAVMPGLAGLSRMPYPRFLIYNAAGGVVWGVGVTLLGYFAGRSYDRVASLLSRSSIVLIGVLLVAALVVWHGRHRLARSHTLEERTRDRVHAGRIDRPGHEGPSSSHDDTAYLE
jgi:membrane-associated protein